jgi:hypothetical protein
MKYPKVKFYFDAPQPVIPDDENRGWENEKSE